MRNRNVFSIFFLIIFSWTQNIYENVINWYVVVFSNNMRTIIEFFFQTIAMHTCALYWIYNCFSTLCGNDNITSSSDLAKQRSHLAVCYLIGIVFCTLNELPDGSVLRFCVGKQKAKFVLFYVPYVWENSDYSVEVIQNSGPNEKTNGKT